MGNFCTGKRTRKRGKWPREKESVGVGAFEEQTFKRKVVGAYSGDYCIF